MKTLLAILALSVTLCATLPAAQLLLNGNFEGPVVASDGNHLGTVPDNWSVASIAAPTTANSGLSNLSRGVVTTGTGVTSPNQYLGLCPYDTGTHPDGTPDNQSLDGNGADVIAFQTFTPAVTLNTPVEIRISFGGRDSTSGNAATTGSSWQLINTANNTVLAADSGYKPATGNWVLSDVVTGSLTLTAGVTYKFQVTLDNAAHMDAASITTIPEPSALVALGGLLLAGGCVRLVRARRA